MVLLVVHLPAEAPEKGPAHPLAVVENVEDVRRVACDLALEMTREAGQKDERVTYILKEGQDVGTSCELVRRTMVHVPAGWLSASYEYAEDTVECYVLGVDCGPYADIDIPKARPAAIGNGVNTTIAMAPPRASEPSADTHATLMSDLENYMRERRTRIGSE